MKILLTTTSFQDTPGKHHAYLASSGLEVVRARGPLNDQQLLELIAREGGVDGLLNGDDQITARVIDALLPQLKVIAKYGIGLDSIDVEYATQKRIPILFTPGVNHTTVAEHTFGLMIALAKRFGVHLASTRAGGWKRVTGTELFGKTLGVIGMGRVGKEVITRAVAFGMQPVACCHLHWDGQFAQQYGVRRARSADEVLQQADIVSLHMNLTDDNRQYINKTRLAAMKTGAMLINTARGGLVNEQDVADACRSGQLGGYATDVISQEPMTRPHPFDGIDNIIITPHIGSRTFESVERQAMRAATNIVNYLTGGNDFIQANRF